MRISGFLANKQTFAFSHSVGIENCVTPDIYSIISKSQSLCNSLEKQKSPQSFDCEDFNGGDGEIRTLARFNTPTPLAGEPLIATWVHLHENTGATRYSIWRRERDSNPRDAINVYTISNRAPSTNSAISPTDNDNYNKKSLQRQVFFQSFFLTLLNFAIYSSSCSSKKDLHRLFRKISPPFSNRILAEISSFRRYAYFSASFAPEENAAAPRNFPCGKRRNKILFLFFMQAYASEPASARNSARQPDGFLLRRRCDRCGSRPTALLCARARLPAGGVSETQQASQHDR